jgi:hypothetical protein
MSAADVVLHIPATHIPDGLSDRGDEVKRQWFTRMLTIASLPFELTLALDTNVKICSCVVLEAMRTWYAEGVDVVINAMHPPKRNWGVPNGWFMGFRNSARSKCVLRDWIALQVAMRPDVAAWGATADVLAFP